MRVKYITKTKRFEKAARRLVSSPMRFVRTDREQQLTTDRPRVAPGIQARLFKSLR